MVPKLACCLLSDDDSSQGGWPVLWCMYACSVYFHLIYLPQMFYKQREWDGWPHKPGLQSRAICDTVCTLSIANLVCHIGPSNLPNSMNL